jgi:hypothetical protein
MARTCLGKGQRLTTVRLLIKVSFSTNGNTEDSLTMAISFIDFTYYCQFNHCNQELTDNKMRKAVSDHFNFSSIYRVFKTKLQEKQTTKLDSGFINYSTSPSQRTSQSPNTSILHFISMNIFVLHILFLIFF